MVNKGKLMALFALNSMKGYQAAKQLHMSYNTLSKKMSGERDFKLSEIEQIKNMFNLSVEDIGEIFFE